MNVDPLFLTIGLLALFNAVRLKLNQSKAKRREREMMERAAVIAARRQVVEKRGSVLAAEREWMDNKAPVNAGKVWE